MVLMGGHLKIHLKTRLMLMKWLLPVNFLIWNNQTAAFC